MLTFRVFEDAVVMTALLVVAALNSAFLDVVVDALMVTQSRKDLANGSEDLQGLSWALLSIGGICGSICSAYFTQYLKPWHTFFTCSLFSLLIVVAGYYINPEVETVNEDNIGFWPSLKSNAYEIKEALKIPVIYKTILFFVLSGLFVPSFGDIAYYFAINVVEFNKATISLLTLVGYIGLLAGTILHNKYLKEKEIRTLLKYSIYISFIGSLFNLMFVTRVNVAMGVNDLFFIVFTSIVTDTLGLAFSNMPSLVLFAKATPKHVEATVFAVFTGLFNLSNGLLSPNMGILINKLFVGVTLDNLSKFYQLVIIQLVLVLTPLLIIGLIPLKAEIVES